MSLFSRRVDKQLEAYQRELVDTHYKEVENMYRQIRGWRHDYRNHIQVLKAFAAKGDMDAIRAYLDELDTDLNTVDTVVKTGNAMADAILNSKISLAKSRGITVQADAHIPVKLKMSELDLCCILGNLFDNAIEASMALPEKDRLIRVYMDMKGTQLYISFTNFNAGRSSKRPAGASAPRRARGTASVSCASTISSRGWTGISPATARTARSRPRYCSRRCERNGSSPKISHSSPVCAGDEVL